MTKAELQAELEAWKRDSLQADETITELYAEIRRWKESESVIDQQAMKAEARVKELELQIATIQTELVTAKNESWTRASFYRCCRRLVDMGLKPPQVLRGLVAASYSTCVSSETFGAILGSLTRYDLTGQLPVKKEAV